MEDYLNDEDLEEEQLDFSCFEEEYERSPPSFPPLVTPKPPASPKSATFTPSNAIKTSNPPSFSPVSRPLILRPMSEYFDSSCTEMTHVHYWTPRCLSKLASVLGKPIQCDKLTSTKERLSYAWVLMEVDLLTDFKSSINVTLPNGKPLIQRVIYETFPKFCKHCKVLAHFTKACSKGKKEGKTVENAGPTSVASKEYVKGSVFSRLSPIVDPLVNAPPVATHPVEVSPIDAPSVNAPKLDAPISPLRTCVAQEEQLCTQALAAVSEER
ncbi:hypothetical protein NC651_021250 [Populus alba x Populus x berolinensis]|nr:hypothetical protein NC651_021250 [Populus alba x Populus x berolinensis]